MGTEGWRRRVTVVQSNVRADLYFLNLLRGPGKRGEGERQILMVTQLIAARQQYWPCTARKQVHARIIRLC